MDVFDALKALFEEKKRVEKLIGMLEARQRIQSGLPPRRRRGRISMGVEERQQVSERMRRYWEQRRRGSTAVAC
jgi:hypothetical protein